MQGRSENAFGNKFGGKAWEIFCSNAMEIKPYTWWMLHNALFLKVQNQICQFVTMDSKPKIVYAEIKSNYYS